MARPVYRRLLAAALGVALVAAGSTSASAEPIQLVTNHTCAYPLIDAQPAQVTRATDLPEQVTQGRRLDRAPMQSRFLLGRQVAEMMRLARATSVKVTMVSDIRIKPVVGPARPLESETEIDWISVPQAPDDEFEIVFNTYLAPLDFPDVGEVSIKVYDVFLNLTLRRSDGSIVIAHEVHCMQDPGQDNLLAAIRVAAPAAPANLRTTDVGIDTVELAWDSTGQPAYEVFRDGELAATVPGTTARVSGLLPDTDYVFTVRSPQSPFSAPLSVHTRPRVTHHDWNLAGAATLKAAHTSVALRGTLGVDHDVLTGNFTADLKLDPATATMTLNGMFPATARVSFTPIGKMTGTFRTARVDVGITLSNLTIFGFPLPVAPCRTTAPTALDMSSVNLTMAGSFTIAPFTGCAPVTNLVTSNVSGPDNPLEVRLS
ncbi:fibronectin type III domain-containing protein [Actinokineospora xionganensis]|uniref:Fibronectin type III domain-containing protein n=1 Tax=Actinokineospora xionganensis TaxID=2684470 RepID=A0ABR7L3H5_9PSEU|nr:fibronectin type III domain-containing protein [Actinokineospora xionganensis]MBC6447240.1 fibronectin type III domain-containing protein [Actinokineospora xionganensis]